MIVPQSCSWLSPYFITFFIRIRSIVSALYITLNGKFSKHASLLLKNSTRKHCWVSLAVRSRQQSESSPVGCTVTSIHPNSTTGSSTAENNNPSSVLPGEVELPLIWKYPLLAWILCVIDLVLSTPRPSGRWCSNFVAAALSRARLLEVTIRRIYPYDNWPEEGWCSGYYAITFLCKCSWR